MKQTIVAFGANLGDPARLYQSAAEYLQAEAGITQLKQSPLYRTDPVGGPDASLAYLNGAFAFQTSLDPTLLLKVLQAAQQSLGGKREGNWQPRKIDLDLVWMEETVFDQPELVVPHPRMHYRWFVLRPCCDLAPGATHPLLDRSLRDLLTLVESPTPTLLFVGGTDSLAEQLTVDFAQRYPASRTLHCPDPGAAVNFQRLGNQVLGVRPELGNSPATRRFSPTWAVVLADERRDGDNVDRDGMIPAVDCRSDTEPGSRMLFQYFLDSLRIGTRSGS